MSLQKIVLLCIYSIGAFFLTNCNDEEIDPGPCFELRDSRYRDLTTTKFSVNGSEDMYQNYTPYTYRDEPSKTTNFAKLWQIGGTEGQITLYFKRIDFDDNCNPIRKHGFALVLDIDQLPTESKTYNVGSIANGDAYAWYAFGEALEEGELIRNSLNEAGTITVTKFVPGNTIKGSFDCNIDGIAVKGEFDYDLKNDYTDIE